MNRLFEVIRNPSYSRTTSLLVILIIALSIPLTVFVAQKQQELRQQAETNQSCIVNEEGELVCTPQSSTTSTTDQSCITNEEGVLVCTTPAPATSVTTPAPPFPGGEYRRQSPDGSTIFWFDPATGKTRTFTNGVEQFSTTPAPTATQTPAAAQVPAASPRSLGGPTTVCKRAGEKGAISTCDPSKDTGKDGTKNNPQRCPKLCPDGKTTVSGVSVMECQSDFCWYDSLYDTNKGNQQQRTDQFCYYGPTNDPKEAGCPTAIATPTAAGIPCNVGVTCPAGCYGATTGVGTGTQVCRIINTNDICTSGGPVCPTPSPTTTQGVSCDNIDKVNCGESGCEPRSVGGGRYLCYKISSVAQCTTTPTCVSVPTAQAPTPTPVPVSSLPNTKLTFTIGLDGLGTVGDSQNPSTSKVNTPKRTSKTFFFQIFDSTGTTEQTKGETQISYDSGLGKFKIANLDIGKGLPNDKYVAKVRVAGYKARIIRNITISGQTAEVPSVNLPTGDINPNNDVNLIDYESLRGCMFKDGTGNCEAADLDESGKVDEFDYNLFLRDFAAAKREE